MVKRGFTLIELIVVIAIIAVLAAVVAPNAFKAIDKARISNVIASYKNIKTAAAQYFGDTGQWPASCADLTACQGGGFLKDPGSVSGWDGPYLDKWPLDPWTGNITYTDASGTVFNATAADERFVTIEGAPSVAQSRIDAAIDGSDVDDAGTCRYDANGIYIVVNRDGPVD